MTLLAFLLLAAAQQPAVTAEPPLRFAPFTVEVNVAYGSGRAARDCRVVIHGEPEPHWFDNACRNISEPDFLTMLGVGEDGGGRLTVLLAMETGGTAAGPATPAGALVFRSRAEFAVGRDGSILRCASGESVGAGDFVDLCEAGFPKTRRPFVAAEQDRQGRLSLTAFEQRAPGRDDAP